MPPATSATPVRDREREAVLAVPGGLLIGGRWTPAASGATFPVDDPSTGAVLREVADAGPEDALRALAAAHGAQAAWGAAAPLDRAAVLRRGHEAMGRHAERLALLLTLEMGKPLAEAREEVAYAAEYLLWFAGEAIRPGGRFSASPDAAGRVLVTMQPVGPCLIVTPWNFPLVMAARAIAPALAAGCAVVVKPSRLAPLATLELARVLAGCGLPDGVLNVVTGAGSRAITEPLMADARLRQLTFTGSLEAGQALVRASAERMLRTSMELGGNAPFIVFADADLDAALRGALLAKMRNGGQTCTSANRFYVARPLAEAFTGRLAAALAGLRVGRPVDEGVQVGPMIEQDVCTRLSGLVADAVDRGAEAVCGGRPLGGPGCFFEPTVLAGVPPEARVMREEIFGPVAPVAAFDDEDDVVELANDTPFGLAAYMYTRDLDRALRVAERLETGMVGLNQGVVSNPMAPFGGVKQSGVGRAGGPEAIEEYQEAKYVAIARG